MQLSPSAAERPATSLRTKLLHDAAGHVLAGALQATVRLGLADMIGGDTRTSSDLAQQSHTDERSLYRLLHFLAGHGYVTEVPERSFALTPMGDLLRTTGSNSTYAAVSSLGRGAMWEAFGNLGDVLRTGRPAHQRRGRDLYKPEYSQAHEKGLAHAMAAYHHAELTDLPGCFDFTTSNVLVDVGGSLGYLMCSVLAAHPHLRGIIFDRPGVAGHARAFVAAAGLQDRCSFVGGSFFDVVPSDADTYILSHIIHDWPDAEALNILNSCRRAMSGRSKLLVIEHLSSDGEFEAEIPFDMLLLANTEGRLRTLIEHRSLLAEAGLNLVGRHSCAAGATILEAVPIDQD